MRPNPLHLAIAIGLGLSLPAGAARAQSASEVAELRAELAALKARIADMEARLATAPEAQTPPAPPLAEAPARPETRAETKGGLKLVSADGRFEATLGGRMQFDLYAFDEDFMTATGSSEFRRARLSLAGKAYGWDYKLEQDFAAGTNLDGLRDAWIATEALGGRFTIGHFKPYRAIEELTSSNEILMMERPFSSATGLFSSRQFQQGVGYLRGGGNYSAGLSLFNLRSAAAGRNEGLGAAGRVTYAPINGDERTLHLGGWFSIEDLNKDSPSIAGTFNYAGRRGPAQTLALVAGGTGERLSVQALEAAGSFGPLFFQGEYAHASFGRPNASDHELVTWYLQGSWLLNGGHRGYKPGTGVFGAPKVTDRALWELTARYDTAENRDVADMRVDSWILGVNYYLNPSLRFMFNYTQGDNAANGDQTAQYALRTQFSW